MTQKSLPTQEKTSKLSNKHRPWRVTLWVEDNRFSTKLRPVSYFVRCEDPSYAINLAYKLWERWEKKEKGYAGHEEFPEISVGVRNQAVCLDEGDWTEYLKDAVSWAKKAGGVEYIYAGDNPAYPRFWTAPGLVFDEPGFPTLNPNPYADYPKITKTHEKSEVVAAVTFNTTGKP